MVKVLSKCCRMILNSSWLMKENGQMVNLMVQASTLMKRVQSISETL